MKIDNNYSYLKENFCYSNLVQKENKNLISTGEKMIKNDFENKNLIKKSDINTNRIYLNMLNIISDNISNLVLINIQELSSKEKYFKIIIVYYANESKNKTFEMFYINENKIEKLYEFIKINNLLPIVSTKSLNGNSNIPLLLQQKENKVLSKQVNNNTDEKLINYIDSFEESFLNNLNKMFNLHEEKSSDKFKLFSLSEQEKIKNYFNTYENEIDKKFKNLIDHFSLIEEKTNIFYQKKLEEQYEKMLKHNEEFEKIENIFSKQKNEINVLISSLKEKDETISNLTNKLDNFLSKLNKLVE